MTKSTYSGKFPPPSGGPWFSTALSGSHFSSLRLCRRYLTRHILIGHCQGQAENAHWKGLSRRCRARLGQKGGRIHWEIEKSYKNGITNKNSLFGGPSIGESELCVKRKSGATYCVSRLSCSGKACEGCRGYRHKAGQFVVWAMPTISVRSLQTA